MKRFNKWGWAVFFACAGLHADNNTTMPNFEQMISQDEIQAKVKEIAAVLDADYQGKEITLILVMKGAMCIGADLIRALKTPCTVEYIRASSYGQRGTQRGGLTIEGADKLDIASKDVLLVDDIFDTGITITKILDKLQEKKPASIKSLVLLAKNGTSQVAYRPDYVLFDIEDKFVIGFGLDYKEYYRGLPGIYIYK